MKTANGLVYLAGAIANVSGYEATQWREDVALSLASVGIATRNPMRAKQFLSGQALISSTFHTYEDKGVFFTSRGIMTRDFNDVKQSDVLLVNLLGAKKPSLGTIMELAWAFALQKPAVVVIEDEGNPHDLHPMLHESMSFRVNTLDEGVRAVAVILGKSIEVISL
jgi:nucleoside 2-deoxyribosyltransferase